MRCSDFWHCCTSDIIVVEVSCFAKISPDMWRISDSSIEYVDLDDIVAAVPWLAVNSNTIQIVVPVLHR